MSHQPSQQRSIVSPEDQSATFIELFFDLVFVFSVTQVVSLLHHGLDWLAIGQAVLVFWLVWWAWTQFTWALNAADTTHPLVELGTLLATGVAFFMAVTLPQAFHDAALWFAIAYVLVRILGLTLYIWVAWTDPVQRVAVRTFGLVSMGGLVAVLLGGLFGGVLQYILWGLTILLDVIAALRGAQAEGWNLHPEHFSERHGLFVIIALGETLIVAAGGMGRVAWSSDLLLAALLAVAITCTLWWSYFTRVKPMLDRALEARDGPAQAMVARDVYSLVHFPMFCGVIAYAVVIEAVITHASTPLHWELRLALAVGLLCFVGGAAIAVWRATKLVLAVRLILILITAGLLIGITGIAPLLSLAIAFVGVLLIVVIEQRMAV